MKKQDYIKLFDRFRDLHLLVIGDVMVDSYLWGQVERISPEAPVPIVAVQKRENRLGGAANVALNVRAIGASATLLTVVGDDMKGREFSAMLNEAGISDAGVVYSHRRVTTTKFRVIGNKVQMLRVDEEVDHPLVKEDMELMLQRFDQLIEGPKVDAIIFQDYDKGVITPELIHHVVRVADVKGIPVAVDPKQRNFMEYRGVTLFKPNLKELREGLKLDHNPQGDALIAATAEVQEKISASIILVTLSEKGVYIRRRAEEGIEEH
ncbi:MAG: D-glycero-beta-D-manno-heptose-7-phosphate kinase, partial [Bacteroidales bacterium]|nr:D-glycero-beta-D-manno-heptose-7-phosphate kinase [Bacteroidales bacterium]